MLVIPKNHSQDLLDTDDDSLAHVAKIAKRMGHILKETTGANGFNMGVNNGAAAGQEVFHLHLHVIPRFEGDGFSQWPRNEYAEGEKAVLAEQLRTTLQDHFEGGDLDLYPKRPMSTSDAIIVNEEGNVLLAQRGTEPFKGLWGLPGGKMDWGETIEQTCVREAKEETGLDIEVDELFSVESDPDRYNCKDKFLTVNHNFVCRVIGGKLQPCRESTDFKWVGPDEVPEQMCFDHRAILVKYFESKA